MNHIEGWPVISALMDEALDLPPEARQRWLEQLPQSAQVYRPLLATLMDNHERAASIDFMGHLPQMTLPESRDDPGIEPEMQVGPYRLIREIGRGGMGSVWLAERSDGQIRREIALKLAHPALTTRLLRRRVLQERDILAGLVHPNIAPLHDAGVTDDGRVFLALAYVKGTNLIEHCDARHLGVRERIQLFTQVLDAVQYAHAQLVIHRDIKPSNVLVDADSHVYLLDFGIAKILVDGESAASELTLEAGPALTASYASPEQIAGTHLSTASDVYSLGVLLHELLVGARPYDLALLSRPEMVRAMRDIDIARPSSRAAEPALRRQLRGDLDTIVLKALKKEPTDRYGSAEAFKQDLHRYLEGTRVLAQRDTRRYRTAKFLSRYRYGVLSVALLTTTLAAGLATTLWQAAEARDQAERAETVKDFVIGLFQSLDPAVTAGKEPSGRELLDHGRRELDKKLASQPLLKLEMTGTLARMYAQIDDNATALELALSWRDQAIRLKGTSSVEYGDAESLLGAIHTSLRDMDRALASFKLARQAYAGHSNVRQKEQLRVETSLGFVLDDIHRYAEAAEILEAVMPRIVKALGAGSWEAVDNRSNLAFTYMKLGNATRALALDQDNEQYFAGLPEFTRSAVAGLYENMAANQLDVWHLPQARTLEEKAFTTTRQLLGADANESIRMEHQLGYIVAAGGDIPQSITLLDDARARARRVIHADNLLDAQLESLRIRPYLLAGRLDEAAGSIRKLLDNKSPEVRKNIFLVHCGYGLVLLGRADEASPFLEQRIAQLSDAGKGQGIPFGHLLHTLAGVRLAQGRWKEADELGARAERAYAADPLHIAIYAALAQLTRALALSRAGDTERSAALVTQAERVVAETVASSHPLNLYVQLVQSEVRRAGGKGQESDLQERDARRRLFEQHGITLPVPTPYTL